MPAILGPNGLTIQTETEIADEYANRVRQLTGNASLSFEGSTLLGQLDTAGSDRTASLQELLQGLNDSQNLMNATGEQLTAYCLKGGIIRKAATRSLVTDVRIGGTTGTICPVGTLLGIPNIANRFSTQSTVTIAAATAWATSTTYVAGNVRKANGQVWQCATGGTSAVSGSGPAYSGNPAVLDGTVRWHWLGNGDGFATVNARAVDTGPIGCAAGGLTIIVTPVAGVTGCDNLNSAAQGSNAETDSALRLRYFTSYHLPGSATINAILADILAQPDVAEARVYQNVTDITGAGSPPVPGLPPHAVWAIVSGTATAAVIGASLLDTVAAGIRIGWATAPNAVDASTLDSQGVLQPIYYSTPVSVPVDVNVAIVYGSVTGPATVASGITAYLDNLTIGYDVRLWIVDNLAGDAMVAAGVNPELIDSITITMRRGSDPFVAANVAIDYNEQATAGAVSVTFS